MWPDHEADHSPQPSGNVKNVWSYTSSLSQYVFMVWCFVKQGICLHCVVQAQEQVYLYFLRGSWYILETLWYCIHSFHKLSASVHLIMESSINNEIRVSFHVTSEVKCCFPHPFLSQFMLTYSCSSLVIIILAFLFLTSIFLYTKDFFGEKVTDNQTYD